MGNISRAIETSGVVEDGRRILLDQPLPQIDCGRARVIVLVDEAGDVDEDEWLRAAAGNPTFAFLASESELYTPDDGRPLHPERERGRRAMVVPGLEGRQQHSAQYRV